jgi:hypothetical protein
VTVETVTGLQGKPVDVVVDPAERQARGLPEKIDSSEYHFGTEATYLSDAETKISDLKSEAVALALSVSKSEFGVDLGRFEAGLKFIELQVAALAEGHDWETWFSKHVSGVNIRTVYRYMALARAPEPTPKPASNGRFKSRAKDVLVATDSTVSDDEAPTETLGESPRRRLVSLVSKLSETEAALVLAMVMKWRAKR